MFDGSEERKRQLAFELQSSRVFEKRSNVMSHDQLPSCYLIFLYDQFFSLAVNEPAVNKPRSMILYVFLGFASALLLLSSVTFSIWCYRRKRRKEVDGFVQFYVLTTDVKKNSASTIPIFTFWGKVNIKVIFFPHFFFRSLHPQRVIYPLDEWEILPEQIEYEGELGRGAFGVVHKATLRKRVGIEVFDKEISKRQLLSNNKAPQVVAVKVLHGNIKNEI